MCTPRHHADSGSSHAFDAEVLAYEEKEFDAAFRLLCPSEPVLGRSSTRVQFGTSRPAYVRIRRGTVCARDDAAGWHWRALRSLAGTAAVRKGLHFALEAWLQSDAHRHGTFRVAGQILPDYERLLAPMLAHPSIEVLGHRDDVPDLMRQSDVLVLPSVEEGLPLVCMEAMGSGCVPLVSDACTGYDAHLKSSLVHRVGDVGTLTEHLDLLDTDRRLLARLRQAGIDARPTMTWEAAGRRLIEVYGETIEMFRSSSGSAASVCRRRPFSDHPGHSLDLRR